MALTKDALRRLRHEPIGARGNRVAVAIELSGQTSTALAEALGFTLTYVSDVSRGRWDSISLENARKFAAHFGCSIEDLFPARDGALSA